MGVPVADSGLGEAEAEGASVADWESALFVEGPWSIKKTTVNT